MPDSLLKVAADAVEIALAAGATAARAGASRSSNTEFSLRDGKVEKVQESTSQSLGVRVWVDDRSSVVSTTDFRPDLLKAFLAEAVAMTKLLEADPDVRLADAELYAGRSTADLELVDAEVVALDRDARLGLCLAQNDVVRGKDGVISVTSWCSDGHDRSAIASSNGLQGTEESTSLWVGTEVTMRDGPDKKPEAGFYAGAHHLGAVPDRGEVGRKAFERALTRVGETKGPTTKAVMVVDPSVAASLVQRLLGAASGWAVHQGRSFFAGKLGQKVVSDKLTIVDDPLVVRGLGSRHYDGEGIAARKLPLLTAGRLDNLYLDTTYARKLGMAPTTGGGSNRVVTPGLRDVDAILADLDGGVYVTGWLGGNSDGTTGDFSLGCRGHVVKDGKIGPSVGEMNVTGNLLALFAQLVEVGSDPWPYGSTRVPTLVFDGVQFSGA